MMARLVALLARFTPRPDLVLHLVAGAAIAVVVWLITGQAFLGMCAAGVAGIAKEAIDSRRPGSTVDVLDALATVAPGVLLWLLIDGGAPPSFVV